MLYIGAQQESIAEARGAINDILRSAADQSTKVSALQVLSTLCKVENVRIEGCSFEGSGKETP